MEPRAQEGGSAFYYNMVVWAMQAPIVPVSCPLGIPKSPSFHSGLDLVAAEFQATNGTSTIMNGHATNGGSVGNGYGNIGHKNHHYNNSSNNNNNGNNNNKHSSTSNGMGGICINDDPNGYRRKTRDRNVHFVPPNGHPPAQLPLLRGSKNNHKFRNYQNFNHHLLQI